MNAIVQRDVAEAHLLHALVECLATEDAAPAAAVALEHFSPRAQAEAAAVWRLVVDGGASTRTLAKRVYCAIAPIGGGEEANLRELLRDDEAQVRKYAAQAFGSRQWDSAWVVNGALREALDDPKWEVRAEAFAALLRRSDGGETEQLLADTLTKEAGYGAADFDHRLAVMAYLEAIADGKRRGDALARATREAAAKMSDSESVQSRAGRAYWSITGQASWAAERIVGALRREPSGLEWERATDVLTEMIVQRGEEVVRAAFRMHPDAVAALRVADKEASPEVMRAAGSVSAQR